MPPRDVDRKPPARSRTAVALLGLLKAAHPGPAMAVTAIAVLLSLAAGRSVGGCVLMGAAILSGQLSIGWLNDYLDRQRDVAAGRPDKPLALGTVPPAWVRRGVVVSAALCVPLSLLNGWRSGVVHLFTVASAWSYDLGLKATRWSWVPFAVSFGLLPSVVTLALPGHPWPAWWGTLAGALLGVAAHIANALPDLADDRELGVLGFPQRLGEMHSRLLASFLLLAGTAVLAIAPGLDPQGVFGLLVAVSLAAAAFAVPKRERSRLPFVLTVAIALVDVLLLLARGGDLTS